MAIMPFFFKKQNLITKPPSVSCVAGLALIFLLLNYYYCVAKILMKNPSSHILTFWLLLFQILTFFYLINN